jgi:hypothetical protein
MAVLSPIMRARAGRRPKKLFCAFFAALTFMSAGPGLPAQTTVSREYQIKAAFLFNFAQFVDWPPTAFTNAEAPLCIGVLGEDPFGTALEQTVLGETVHNRKLIVQHSRRVEDLTACQLVFISKSEKGHLAEILSKLDGREALTVSEIDGFARRGGIINFYLDGNKVRFEINPTIAQQVGLKMSSQLLSLGKIVQPEPVKEDK